MKAVGYHKSLPVSEQESLFDFVSDRPEPAGRDLRVAVKAVSLHWEVMFVRRMFDAPDMSAQHLLNEVAAIIDEGLIVTW